MRQDDNCYVLMVGLVLIVAVTALSVIVQSSLR
jgi:hypothetical protein